MRLDYVLYSLAVILFAITAITFALVAEQEVRNIYMISTALVGVLSIGGGYLLRPKTPTKMIQTEEPKPETVVNEPVLLTQNAEAQAPKASPTENLVFDSSQVKANTSVEGSSSEPASLPKPSVEPPSSVVMETTKLEVPPTAALSAPMTPAAISAPLPKPALEPPETQETNSNNKFVQIRGISERRANQLMANGINTIQDLASASATDLASKLNVSPKIVKMWIGSAKKLVK